MARRLSSCLVRQRDGKDLENVKISAGKSSQSQLSQKRANLFSICQVATVSYNQNFDRCHFFRKVDTGAELHQLPLAPVISSVAADLNDFISCH